MVGTLSAAVEKVKRAFYIQDLFFFQNWTVRLTWWENVINSQIAAYPCNEIIENPIYMVSGHKNAVLYKNGEHYNQIMHNLS